MKHAHHSLSVLNKPEKPAESTAWATFLDRLFVVSLVLIFALLVAALRTMP